MEDDCFDQDDDDNIFDDDDALNYIMYEECERDIKKSKGTGCLGVVIIIMLIPVTVAVVLL